MWSDLSVLHDEKVVNNTFSINSLFQIAATEKVSY